MPTATQILRILRYLAGHPAGARASVMAAELGLPRSTTYRLLGIMSEEGFVLHHPDDQTYGLGAGAFEIANSYGCDATLERLGEPLLTRMVEQQFPKAIGQLSVLRSRETLHLLRKSGVQAPVSITNTGVRLPAHLTATGRAMLSCHTQEQVRALFDDQRCFVLRTGTGPTNLRELHEVLRNVRALGYARETNEIAAGLASVAAAVVDPTGYPLAAIGLTFRAEELDSDLRDRAGHACRQAALEVAYRLHGARRYTTVRNSRAAS
ncbi:IclR family transcriptional regulator [Acrocarpospora catenulata]|uniref:IclR family transcriptional regulator n=1 Tax=Acrocarpospora catenulata TaxID=2836182 RepID=UPI001BDA2711|nr:IclR family transcriptional regulator C-terminal domain-containing protein [Acrocarpospora catenulata]